jgi:transcriptional regulator of acetoin/glycerol metabolism
MDVLVGPRVPIAASNRYVEGSRPSMSGLLLRSPDPTLWERFLEDPGRLPADDPVVARWARVRALGVSPEGQEPVVLEASHLAEHKEQLACLLEAAYPLLWDAAREFSRRDYTLLLADAEGVIVERFGGGAFEAVARQSRLVEGATWHEAVRGTNAIGTAVAEGASVAVEGCAHWERENHGLSCYASPIHDPQGRLVAVVDATSFSATAAGFAPLAVSTLARGIEAQLRLRAYEACGGLSTMQRALRHVTGGDRQRQGAGGAGDPPRQPPRQGALRGAELRGAPGEPPGERALRLRPGRLHRRPRAGAGLFRAAEGGTLFLDEIGEMPMALQAKLLRVLEEQRFERVGGNQTLAVDVRIIAATHRDLSAMVANGTFREDLYYRLNVLELEVPPLRARRADIPILVEYALGRIARECGGARASVSDEAMAQLVRYDWPGNVRELKTALAHAYALEPDLITAENLPDLELGAPASFLTPAPRGDSGLHPTEHPVPSRRESEAEALDLALEASHGNLSDAARRLGVARSTLYRMMRRYGRHR